MLMFEGLDARERSSVSAKQVRHRSHRASSSVPACDDAAITDA
jgi:hypothetical protein